MDSSLMILRQSVQACEVVLAQFFLRLKIIIDRQAYRSATPGL